MENNYTIGEITQNVENASTNFETNNTDLKRKYLIWCIHTFRLLASKVSVSKGSFGTGYPFLVLDSNLEGKLPIIPEQIRYNRQLVKDGKPFQKSIWECKKCLENNYKNMPDLKTICKPCPKIHNLLKPRKLINRLPDIDMWLICEDGKVEQAELELTALLKQYNMNTSDVNPINTIQEIINISEQLKNSKMPSIYLPIDAHIVEYSTIKDLIKKTPLELLLANITQTSPYVPIYPKSYRKTWQYDDTAYNFIYDYLSAFTDFDFDDELKDALDKSRFKIMSAFSKESLLDFLLDSATEANKRRYVSSSEMKDSFYKRIDHWDKTLSEKYDYTVAIDFDLEDDSSR